jgi:hypothetical protein
VHLEAVATAVRDGKARGEAVEIFGGNGQFERSPGNGSANRRNVEPGWSRRRCPRAPERQVDLAAARERGSPTTRPRNRGADRRSRGRARPASPPRAVRGRSRSPALGEPARGACLRHRRRPRA